MQCVLNNCAPFDDSCIFDITILRLPGFSPMFCRSARATVIYQASEAIFSFRQPPSYGVSNCILHCKGRRLLFICDHDVSSLLHPINFLLKHCNCKASKTLCRFSWLSLSLHHYWWQASPGYPHFYSRHYPLHHKINFGFRNKFRHECYA